MAHWRLKAGGRWRCQRRAQAWLLGLGLMLAACTPQPTPGPLALRVEATDLAAPLLADLAQAYAGINPGISVQVETVSLSTLADDLAAGRADLGLAATYTAGQFATPLGYVAFVPVVNPANPVSRLSAAQARDLFAGRATDWASAGGPAGAVQVVCREDRSDAAETFGRLALEGAPPTLNALVAPTWAAMREAVGQTPAAIGYLPAPEMSPAVKQVAVEAAWRALIVAVAPQAPAGAARDFVAWVQSEAGQAAVAERYEPLGR